MNLAHACRCVFGLPDHTSKDKRQTDGRWGRKERLCEVGGSHTKRCFFFFQRSWCGESSFEEGPGCEAPKPFERPCCCPPIAVASLRPRGLWLKHSRMGAHSHNTQENGVSKRFREEERLTESFFMTPKQRQQPARACHTCGEQGVGAHKTVYIEPTHIASAHLRNEAEHERHQLRADV